MTQSITTQRVTDEMIEAGKAALSIAAEYDYFPDETARTVYLAMKSADILCSKCGWSGPETVRWHDQCETADQPPPYTGQTDNDPLGDGSDYGVTGEWWGLTDVERLIEAAYRDGHCDGRDLARTGRQGSEDQDWLDSDARTALDTEKKK